MWCVEQIYSINVICKNILFFCTLMYELVYAKANNDNIL